jgi:hypothetical protein
VSTSVTYGQEVRSSFRRYERSNIFIDVGLRDAFLEAVLEPHVYAMDILSLWDIAAGTVEVYVYQCIYGFLRSRVCAAVRRVSWTGVVLFSYTSGAPSYLSRDASSLELSLYMKPYTQSPGEGTTFA